MKIEEHSPLYNGCISETVRIKAELEDAEKVLFNLYDSLNHEKMRMTEEEDYEISEDMFDYYARRIKATEFYIEVLEEKMKKLENREGTR